MHKTSIKLNVARIIAIVFLAFTSIRFSHASDCCGGSEEAAPPSGADSASISLVGQYSYPQVYSFSYEWTFKKLKFKANHEGLLSVTDDLGVNIYNSSGYLEVYGISAWPSLPSFNLGELTQSINIPLAIDKGTGVTYSIEESGVGVTVTYYPERSTETPPEETKDDCCCCESPSEGSGGTGADGSLGGGSFDGAPGGPGSGPGNSSDGADNQVPNFVVGMGTGAFGENVGNFVFPKSRGGPTDQINSDSGVFKFVLAGRANIALPAGAEVERTGDIPDRVYSDRVLVELKDITQVVDLHNGSTPVSQTVGFEMLFFYPDPARASESNVIDRFPLPADRTTASPQFFARWTCVELKGDKYSVPHAPNSGGPSFTQLKVTRDQGQLTKEWFYGRYGLSWDISTTNLKEAPTANTRLRSGRADSFTVTDFSNPGSPRVVAKSTWTVEAADNLGNLRIKSISRGVGAEEVKTIYKYNDSLKELTGMEVPATGAWTEFGATTANFYENQPRIWRYVRRPIGNASPDSAGAVFDETLTLHPPPQVEGEPPDDNTPDLTVHLRAGQETSRTLNLPSNPEGPNSITIGSDTFPLIASSSRTTYANGVVTFSASASYPERAETSEPSQEPQVPLHLSGKQLYRISRTGDNASRTDYTYERWAKVATPAFPGYAPAPEGDLLMTTETESVSPVIADNTYDPTPAPQANITRKRTRLTGANQKLLYTQEFLFNGTDYTLLFETRHSYNSQSQLETIERREGSTVRTIYSATYVAGILDTETDEHGVVTKYTNYHDENKPRVITRFGVPASNGLPAIENSVTTLKYDAENRVVSKVVTVPSSATPVSQQITEFDSAGRLSLTSDGVTSATVSYNAHPVTGGQIISKTSSNGPVVNEYRNRDGTVGRRDGDSIVTEIYSSDEVMANHPQRKATVNRGGLLLTSYTDVTGRTVKQEVPNPTAAAPNVPASRTITTEYFHNPSGDLTETKINGSVVANTKRKSLIRTEEIRHRGDNVSVVSFSEQTISPGPDGLFEVNLSKNGGVKRRLTGFGAPGAYGHLTEHTIQVGRQGATLAETFTWNDRTTATTREETWRYGESAPTVRISRNGILQTDLPAGYTAPVVYATDGAGRVKGVTDPRTGYTRQIAYSPLYPSQVATISLTAPNAQNVVEIQTETRDYYGAENPNAGRLSSVTRLGQTTNYAYNSRGQRTHVWGAQYPLKLEYNDAGQLTKMHTYRTAPGAFPWPNGDITEWRYYAGSGKLHQKLDAKQRIAPETPVTYTYDNFGNIASRAWARGVTTNYTVDWFGQVQSLAYSDGTPAVVREGDDGEGRYTATLSGGGTWTHTVVPGLDPYGLPAEVETETMTAPVGSNLANAGYTAVRRYDSVGELESTQFDSPTLADLGYQTTERNPLTRVEDTYQAGPGSTLEFRAYEYKKSNSEQNLGRWAGARFVADGYLAELSVESYKYSDNFDQLSSQSAGVSYQGIGGSYSLSHSNDFSYDSEGRRIRDTRLDGTYFDETGITTYWDYGYNDKNEVTGGTRKLADGTPIPGWSFSYEFDEIGNRTTSGQNGATTTYGTGTAGTSANELNQYTSRTNPPKFHVVGEKQPGTTVFAGVIQSEQTPLPLNESTIASDLGTFFYKGIDYTSGPADLIVASEGRAQNPERRTLTERGRVLAPPVNEFLKYDEDGNLTDDGLWHYTWDAENRLTSATSHIGTTSHAYGVYAPVPVSARKQILYTYDYRSRMIRREVYGWNGTGFNNTPETAEEYTHFIYDGWNLMAEINRTGQLVRRYYWGLDLSGTTDGAGGVGGLVAVQHFVNGDTTAGSFTVSFPIYDGNGNILAYYDATTGQRVADFAYGPFGETIRATGPRAAELPLRWSTKYTDSFTNHKYYGYRWLGDGRWLSRDPIGEEGGVNLFGYVENRVTDHIDIAGLAANPSTDLVTPGIEYPVYVNVTAKDPKGIGFVDISPADFYMTLSDNTACEKEDCYEFGVKTKRLSVMYAATVGGNSSRRHEDVHLSDGIEAFDKWINQINGLGKCDCLTRLNLRRAIAASQEFRDYFWDLFIIQSARLDLNQRMTERDKFGNLIPNGNHGGPQAEKRRKTLKAATERVHAYSKSYTEQMRIIQATPCN